MATPPELILTGLPWPPLNNGSVEAQAHRGHEYCGRFSGAEQKQVVSSDRLLERVWGHEQVVETRSVDVYVGRPRNKLGPARARSIR
jgi:hypothetical protein